MVSTMYEVRLAGAVDADDLHDMGAVVVESVRLSTVICAVPDQAALYGLLDRLRALSIVVTEVRLVPDGPPGREEHETADDRGEAAEAPGGQTGDAAG